MGRPSSGSLSPTQRGMWFLDTTRESSSANHIPVCLDIDGALDVPALNRALSLLAARHDVLRTSFHGADQIPTQRVNEATSLKVVVEDAALVNVDARLEEIITNPFNLAEAPLARVHLLRVSADKQVLVIVVHHIIFDGWSKGVFATELLSAYRSFREGGEPSLPAIDHGYLTFVEWQEKQLEGGRLNAKVEFWREKFSDRPQLELPRDRPKTSTPSYRAATHRLGIDSETVARVTQMAQRLRTTKFSVFLGAFKAVVARLAGQSEVLVATNVANRTRREFQSILGPLINTIVVRTRTDGDPTFEEMVTRVQGTMAELAPHQDVPIELLLEHIRPVRDPSNPGFVEALFILQNTPMPDVTLPGAIVTPRDVESGYSEFEIIFNLYEGEGGEYEVVIEYWTDLYDVASMERFGDRFARFLQVATKDPSRSITDIPLMSAPERESVLQKCQGVPLSSAPLSSAPLSSAPLDGESATLASLFAHQCEQHRNATAVAFKSESLSYGALLNRASLVAQALAGHGVGPGDFVPMLVERSIDGLVAQMGIWLAGAAFAPIDIGAPEQKREQLLTQLSPKAIVTDVAVTATCPLVPTQQSGDAKSFVPTFAEPSDPAYLIFTSGTTGTPKGVVVEHQSLTEVARSWRDEYALGEDTCLLQMGSIAADVFIGDWVKVLTVGGEMVVCPTEDRLEPGKVAQLILQNDVSVVEATPGLLIPAGQYMRNNGLHPVSLELVIFGSDYVRYDEFATFSAWLPQCRVVNGYGLTECTVETSVFEVDANGTPRTGYCPLGRPLPGATMYVLDTLGQLVPETVVGELHVGGFGVSRGYLQNEEATSAKFIVHPEFGRLFCTGDIARMQRDGNVDLLGRADDTVKIRGYRVAIGEVENTLVQLPEVFDAAVVDAKIGGQTDLWAFVVPNANTTDPEQQIKTALSRTLPAYMVPSRIVLLDALPRNANNKVQRKLLRTMKPQRSQAHATSTWTETQQKLRVIWEEVLEHDDFGIDDSFMAVGGTSAMVLRVFNEIQQAFDVPIRVVDLFNSHSIAMLAERLEALAKEER